MSLIADILLTAGALGAGFYCLVLGRRLNRFNDLEKGVGGAVAVLSAQVDDLTRTLNAAQATAGKSAQALTDLSKRAEDVSRRLELQMAALHDLPADPPTEPQAAPKPQSAPAPQPAPVEPTQPEPAAPAPQPVHAAQPTAAQSSAVVSQPKQTQPMFTRHRDTENAA